MIGHRRLILAAAALGAAASLAWRLRPGESLDGRAAVIMGGSRGLGFLLARRLLDAGCRVAVCARDRATLERAVSRLRAETGGRIVGGVCDVQNADQVAGFMAWAAAELGGVDILVNNASIIQVGPVEAMALDDFRRAMDVTYWGAVHACLAALPHLRESAAGGQIVNITSIGSVVAVPHLLPYDGAKFALRGFSEGLAAELAGEGIAVTTVVPGVMRTGSPVHVEYHGQPEKEYAWFALGAVTPLSAVSAERVARRIVAAIRRREPWLTLFWQARLLRATHDLAPSATTRLLGLVNRALPDANGRPAGELDVARGRSLRGTLPAPAEWSLDRVGSRANQ